MKKKRIPRRVWRALGWAALGLFLSSVGAVMLASRMVTPQWLQGVIMAQLQRTFNRPVQIAGVNVLLHQGIQVRGLKVQEAKGFPGDYFLTSDFLVAKYKIWTLLLGRLELREVRLISPKIHLARRLDGAWNFSGILRPSAPDARSSAFTLPVLEAADHIRIERGVLRVDDLARKHNFLVEGFDLKVSDFNLDSPFPLELSFANETSLGSRRVEARCQLRGSMSLDSLKGQGYVSAEKLDLVVDGQRMRGSGALRSFLEPVVELDLKLPAVDSAGLSRYASVPPGISVPPSRWKLKLAFLAKPDSSWEYRLDRLEASAGDVKVGLQGSVWSRSQRCRLTASLLDLPLGKAAALFNEWTAHHFAGLASGQLKLAGPLSSPRVESLSLDLKSFGGILSEHQRLADTDVAIRADARLSNISVTAPRGTYTAFGNVFSNIDVAFLVHAGDMEVKKLGAVWKGGKIGMNGCVMGVASPKVVVVDASADALKLDEVYKTITDIIAIREAGKKTDRKPRTWLKIFKYSIPKSFPDLRGRIHLARAVSPNFQTNNLEILMDLHDISKGLKTVTGNLRVGFGPGRIDNIPEVRQVDRILNVLLLPYVYMHEINAKAVLSLETATPRTMDFTRIYGDFGVRRGMTDVRFLHVDGPQFIAYGDGKMDFPGEKVDLRVLMRLTKPRGQLPDRLVDTAGRPSIQISVTNDLNKPTPELSLRKMQAHALEDALAEGLKRATAFPSWDKLLHCGRQP